MKKLLIFSLFVFLLSIFFLFKISIKPHPLEKIPQKRTMKYSMQVSSSAFHDNAEIPTKYSCQGDSVNPPLTFSEVPSDAKSLSLIVEDPDAPMGTFIHWVVFNIPPTTKEIAEHSWPADSIQGLNGVQKPGYIAACPPSGTHHYFFKLYALDTKLALDETADKEKVEAAMQGHILDQTQLVGLYTKK
jgi:hypothetical protein